MAVNTRIVLPPTAQVNQVAKALGILVGLPKRWHNAAEQDWIEVPGVQVEGSPVPGLAHISLRGVTVLPQVSKIEVTYHIEYEDAGERGMLPISSPFWCAVGRRLVETFGGRIDYNDSDQRERGTQWDFLAEAPEDIIFEAVQERLAKLRPISKAERRKMARFAAYKD